MVLKTKHFGEITVDEENAVLFEGGLPGFECVRRFVIIDNPDASSPFKWLQCIDDPGLAFVIANPFMIRKDYDIEINDEFTQVLGIEGIDDVAVFCIVVVPQDISKISMNLKAPLVINTANKKGMQIVLDTDEYSVRHYILEELRR